MKNILFQLKMNICKYFKAKNKAVVGFLLATALEFIKFQINIDTFEAVLILA